MTTHSIRRHRRRHHRCTPTALVPDGAVCESCRLAPATTTWANPAAGAPFALCQGCAVLVPAPAPQSLSRSTPRGDRS